jgi:hypothetical protein
MGRVPDYDLLTTLPFAFTAPGTGRQVGNLAPKGGYRVV